MIAIDSTTYTPTNKLGDIKPDIYIGGSKDEIIFKPIVEMFFHNNEYSIVIENKNKIIINESAILINDKISQTVNGETDEFYVDENDHLKWDTIFSKIPAVFEIDYNLQYSSGIEFLYQDTLENEYKINPEGFITLEDYLKHQIRPDEIVGSYAVYCNKLNGKYKTGKLCHIYRPHVIDADGKIEWCELKIDSNNLKIILPSAFMQTAKYPVRLDPTIGYTSIGGTAADQSGSTIQLAQMYSSTMSEDGTASKVYVYAKTNSAGSITIHLGYMGDNGANASGVIDGNIDCTITGTTPAWYSVNTAGALTNGNKYHATRCNYLAGISTYRDAGAANDSNYNSTMANDTMIDGPLTVGSSSRYSQYLEYTVAGGGTSAGTYYYYLNNQMRCGGADMQELRHNTINIVRVGVVVNSTGVTPVTNLTVDGADEAELLKWGTTGTQAISGTLTAIANCDGWYLLTFSAAECDTKGPFTLVIQDDNVCLPIYRDFMIVDAHYYDAKYSTTLMTVI